MKSFWQFIHAREALRLNKAGGLPFPWSNDEILNTFKFTNVKREHDRTSALLIKEFYAPHYNDDPEIVLLNAAVARYFGTIEFMRAVGWQTGFKPALLKKTAKTRLAAGERVYTGAYIITSCGQSGPKEEIVVDQFLASLWKNRKNIVAAAMQRHYWRDMFDELTKCEGFGGTGFMAKETMLDVGYTDFWGAGRAAPLDYNVWTPTGPGSCRGAARVLQQTSRTDKDRVGHPATLALCREIFGERALQWPPGWVELELTDIQFQLCEYDKYCRTFLGEGRPRSRYRPPNV